MKSDASVWCWGDNSDGQLGDNTKTERLTPVQVKGSGGSGTLSGVIEAASGETFVCAAKGDGSVWCWGRNDKGQLGNNTTSDSLTPVQVKGAGGSGTLTGAVTLAAGQKHACAVKSDRSVWCWGLNDKGQLGNNTTTNSSYPVQVKGPGGSRDSRRCHGDRCRLPSSRVPLSPTTRSGVGVVATKASWGTTRRPTASYPCRSRAVDGPAYSPTSLR